MTTPPGPPAVPSDVVHGYHALRDRAGVVALPRDVVRVVGPEAVPYLQGQCSQDVAALEVGGSAESLLLSPQGKVEVYFRITRTAADEFVLDTDGAFGPVLVARLERFRLRTKVEFEPLAWVCAAVRGPDAAGGVTGSPELVLPASFASFAGVDLLGPLPAGGLDGWVAGAVARCPLEAWDACRIEAGLPVNGRELAEGTIAAEVGLVDRTVSFTKGCFTGQELVARLDARGSNVARHLRGVVLTGGDGDGRWASGGRDQPAADAGIASLVGSPVITADGREAGHLSSVAWSPAFGVPVALATLHRRVDPPEAVAVQWTPAGGEPRPLAGEARTLPLT